MSDKLNEVGKTLGGVKGNSESALRRHQPVLPAIERARDVFDASTAFEMFFEIRPNQTVKKLDINFQKPPPPCLAGEWTVKCEGFAFTDGDAHLIQLSQGYLVDSLSVYANDVPVSTANIDQVDPDGGLVYVTNLNGATDVVICYFFRCFCGFGAIGYATPKPFAVSFPWETGYYGTYDWSDSGLTAEDVGAFLVAGEGFTFGAALLLNETTVFERGWKVYPCKTFTKINLLRSPNDGITTLPNLLWVDGALTSYTVTVTPGFLVGGDLAATFDKPLGWIQWVLSEAITPSEIVLGQQSSTWLPWMRLNDVEFI